MTSAAHDDLLRANLPARAAPSPIGRTRRTASFPVRAHQLSRRIAIIGPRQPLELSRRRRGCPSRFAELERACAARGEPGFGTEDRREIARPRNLASASSDDGHPFVIGPLDARLRSATSPSSCMVVLRAMLPRVVGDFMIVPLRDHREQLVQALQVGIAAIAGIAQAIIGERGSLRSSVRSSAAGTASFSDG